MTLFKAKNKKARLLEETGFFVLKYTVNEGRQTADSSNAETPSTIQRLPSTS